LSDIEQQPEPPSVAKPMWQVVQFCRLAVARWRRGLLVALAVVVVALLVVALVRLDQWGEVPSGARRAALVAAQTAPSDVASPPSAGPAVAVFIWEDEHGIRHRAAVDKRRLDEYVAARWNQLAQDERRILAVAAQELRDGLHPVFAEMEGRVPQYADWVFNWWTSWILLGRAFAWAVATLPEGPILQVPDRVQTRLVAAIRSQFNALVIDPETTIPKLKPAIEHSLGAARDELQRICRGYETALGDFVRREAQTIERSDRAGGWAADPAWNRAKAQMHVACEPPESLDDAVVRTDLQALLPAMSNGGPVDDVILRLARPFATKLISFVVLPVIVTALVAGFVLPLFGLLPGIISGVVIGILTGAAGVAIIGFSASATVDWILNRTDEALSRARFEADVRKGVTAAELDFESKIVEAQQRSIDQQLQEIIATMVGRPLAR
jgi:hypothetical protein